MEINPPKMFCGVKHFFKSDRRRFTHAVLSVCSPYTQPSRPIECTCNARLNKPGDPQEVLAGNVVKVSSLVFYAQSTIAVI